MTTKANLVEAVQGLVDSVPTERTLSQYRQILTALGEMIGNDLGIDNVKLDMTIRLAESRNVCVVL